MHEYKMPRRLRSEDYIGQGHIAVEEHRAAYYPRHWHNYFEIEIILEGAARHTYNGHDYTVGPGDAYILTPADFHALEAEPSLRLINISFDDVCLPESMLGFLSDPTANKICRLDPEEAERFVMATRLLQHECLTQGPCAGQLLEYLLSCFRRKNPSKADDSLSKEHLLGLHRAISYIELHFRENITLNQLAELSGYSPAYFSELFRKVTGQTYKERLRTLRIHYAQMLLANGFSVSEACFNSGFGSLSNFLTAFKESCGMPPSRYGKSGKHGH